MQRAEFSTLSHVFVSDSVAEACYSHALSTEKEEVMGVLLGEFVPQPDGTRVANVWDSFVIQRSDKRKDRVEIPPERLAFATEKAEERTKQHGKHTKVCGWYHSHPHITPYPSHVDLNTQASFQMNVDQAWVGLIFSVFNFDKKNTRTTTGIHCFASKRNEFGGWERVDVPVSVVPLDSLLTSPLPPFHSASEVADNLVEESTEALKKVLVQFAGPSSALLHHACQAVHTQEMFSLTHQIFVPKTAALATTQNALLDRRMQHATKRIASLDEQESELKQRVAELEARKAQLAQDSLQNSAVTTPATSVTGRGAPPAAEPAGIPPSSGGDVQQAETQRSSTEDDLNRIFALS